MAAEYKTIATADPADDELNAEAAEGWTVKAAYSPTSFLLERLELVAAPVARAQPTPPTGPGRA
jgi:hypothetical protein